MCHWPACRNRSTNQGSSLANNNAKIKLAPKPMSEFNTTPNTMRLVPPAKPPVLPKGKGKPNAIEKSQHGGSAT